MRAGLTPKYIDKHTLVEMLDYTGRSINRTKFLGIEDVQEISTTIFRPPVPDFGVTRFQVGRSLSAGLVLCGVEFGGGGWVGLCMYVLVGLVCGGSRGFVYACGGGLVGGGKGGCSFEEKGDDLKPVEGEIILKLHREFK